MLDQTPVLNHLWQSTLFAGAAGLLTLALRKNRAQTRYWVWLAASVKFLIPFSLLMFLGSYFEWPARTVITPTRLSAVMEEVSQPFSAEVPIATLPAHPAKSNRMPELLALAWVIGFVVVGLRWLLRWRRVRAIVRGASRVPLPIGMEVISSPAMLEPGVFGIFRPVLLLPEGITDRLTPAQLSSIVAHEMWHIRRRDNLATAVHMVVESLFWFHPLVWWLGARLVEERERACDEEVLQSGSDPQVYAEGILKVCEFYLESPLECVAGVSGANLKKRIEEIMTNRVAQKLNFGRKMLLAGVGMLAVAGPVVIGIGAPPMKAQSQQTPPAFEVVSIKPYTGDLRGKLGMQFLPGGRFISRGPLIVLIAAAYGVPFQGSGAARLTGGPSWVNSPEGVYEIEATTAKGAIPEGLSPNALADRERLMLQAMLADRFKLMIRRETKEMPIYALVVGKGGPKLPKADIQEKDCPEAPPATASADGNTVCHRFNGGRGRGLHGRAVDMSDLVTFVQNWTDRPLFDKTGIKGLYHIETEPFQPMELGSSPPPPGTKQDGVDLRDLPTLFTVFERLGLRMESQKGNVDTYVIEHIEKPAEN